MLVKVEVLHKKGDASNIAQSYPSGLLELMETLTDGQKKQLDHYVGELPDESLSLKEENDLGKSYFIMPKTGTEDMYFCYRVKKKGVKIWCDSDVFAYHVGFNDLVGRERTEFYEQQQQGQTRSDSSVPVPEVRVEQESAHTPDDAGAGNNKVSGLRRPVLDTRKSSNLI
jgi:hypothetical protein